MGRALLILVVTLCDIVYVVVMFLVRYPKLIINPPATTERGW
jgi:hypothetical protein